MEATAEVREEYEEEGAETATYFTLCLLWRPSTNSKCLPTTQEFAKMLSDDAAPCTLFLIRLSSVIIRIYFVGNH